MPAAMRRRLAVMLAVALLGTGGTAMAEDLAEIPTRPGISVRALIDLPARASGAVVLLAGGHGHLQLTAGGAIGWGGQNALVRTRGLYSRAGYAVAVPDLAPDMVAGTGVVQGYRLSPAHAQDLGAVIAWMRQRGGGGPVVLVGTSRGTLSAASAAIRLGAGPQRPDAIVLTAGMLMMEAGIDDLSIQRNLGEIARATQPFLLVQHAADACRLTLPSGPERFRPLLRAARSVDIVMITGGGVPRGNPCEAQHHHGFVGQDQAVTDAITAWIARLPRG
jgi:dienelactone hydrolase